MMPDDKEQFHIRYILLNFNVRLCADAVLPEEKTSAIRGGFGSCLMDIQCIHAERPSDCGFCTFREACLVQRIFYAPLKIPVPSVCKKESEGYIISCTDKRTKFREGDMLSFSVTLFGDIIVYLQTVLQAFFQLGIRGLGKEQAAFEIVEIKNQFRQPVLEHGQVLLRNYQFEYLDAYIERRIEEMKAKHNNGCGKGGKTEKEDKKWDIKVTMLSPLSLKYHGKLLKKFHTGGFLNGVSRRVYIMDCFEGVEAAWRKWNDGTLWESFQKQGDDREKQAEKTLEAEAEYLPKMEVLWDSQKRIRRYSSTQQKAIFFDGITGAFFFYGVTEEMLRYLLAGEVLHVGRHSSFGFGKYQLCLKKQEK